MTSSTPPTEPQAFGEPIGAGERGAQPTSLLHRIRFVGRARPGAARALLVVLIALVAGGFAAVHHFATRVTTEDAFVEAHVVAVASRVGGTVAQVGVEANQAVLAGDILVELDPRDFRLAVERAEADLAAAEASLAVAEARVPIATVVSSSGLANADAVVGRARAAAAAASDAIRGAEAHLAAAEAQAERARQDVARLTDLVSKDEVSREDYEHAFSTAAAADAAVAEARQGVEAARNRRAQAEAEIAQARAGAQQATAGPQQVSASRAEAQVAQARVAQSRAALGLARAQLEDTTVRAPLAGIVGRRNVEAGQAVGVGQPLVALVPERYWVTANFKETQLAKVRPGQRAIIHVDAYNLDLRGHVESVGAATGGSFSLLPASNASGNFVKVVQRIPVRIVVDEPLDPLRPLRPGMSVVPTVITG